MQDRTINNALLALYRTGDALEHVEALMALRGVDRPKCVHDRQLSRGKCKGIVMAALPCTTSQAGGAVQAHLGEIKRRTANNRAYQALLRLRDGGHVVRGFGPDGCLWKLAQ